MGSGGRGLAYWAEDQAGVVAKTREACPHLCRDGEEEPSVGQDGGRHPKGAQAAAAQRGEVRSGPQRGRGQHRSERSGDRREEGGAERFCSRFRLSFEVFALGGVCRADGAAVSPLATFKGVLLVGRGRSVGAVVGAVLCWSD